MGRLLGLFFITIILLYHAAFLYLNTFPVIKSNRNPQPSESTATSAPPMISRSVRLSPSPVKMISPSPPAPILAASIDSGSDRADADGRYDSQAYACVQSYFGKRNLHLEQDLHVGEADAARRLYDGGIDFIDACDKIPQQKILVIDHQDDDGRLKTAE